MNTTANIYMKRADGELATIPDDHAPLYYIRHTGADWRVTYLRVTSITPNYVSGFLCDGGWPADKSRCGQYLTVQGERQYTQIPTADIDVMKRERSRTTRSYDVG